MAPKPLSIDFMRASNARLKDAHPGMVGVFVGASSGIGETTAREFARRTQSPRIYIIGRQEERAARVAAELRSLNPTGFIRHITHDLTTLKNVDEICADICAQESKVNVLCLSAGFLSTRGRDETSEGLDKKLSINYYSRWRFVANMMPLLQRAAEKGEIARVLSILSAGKEGKLDLDDLGLSKKDNYTLRHVHDHATTMNSLMVEHFASIHPSIGFVHAFPGWVHTNIAQGLGFLPRMLTGLAYFLLRPWVIPIQESGERHLFAATSDVYSAREATGTPSVPQNDGIRSCGGYLLDWNGNLVGNRALLSEYMKEGVRELVWEHTTDTFERVCGQKSISV